MEYGSTFSRRKGEKLMPNLKGNQWKRLTLTFYKYNSICVDRVFRIPLSCRIDGMLLCWARFPHLKMWKTNFKSSPYRNHQQRLANRELKTSNAGIRLRRSCHQLWNQRLKWKLRSLRWHVSCPNRNQRGRNQQKPNRGHEFRVRSQSRLLHHPKGHRYKLTHETDKGCGDGVCSCGGGCGCMHNLHLICTVLNCVSLFRFAEPVTVLIFWF